MYVRRGSLLHQINESKVRWRVSPQFADNGLMIGTKYYASMQGRIHGTDASDLSAKAVALEAAYSSTKGDWYLLQNDGTTQTHIKIIGSKTVTGIHLTRLEYPNEAPASFSTFLDYELEIEAESGGIGILGGGQNGQDALVSWTETLSFRGTGGPRYVLRENRNGPPQMQMVSQRTPIYATQRGEATGLFQYPSYPNPIWPAYEDLPNRDQQSMSADSVGGSGNQQQKRNYKISWVYQFQASQPIIARPGVGF